ncbi:MAG: bifunctional hydroxymethylpyrimidine kinase/phosphomethylpyrimidine kinase [Desulfovibrio sp.]|nr:bifunctional hydroxymethylpyrimidine kinase/phosphomethylpyrimidine kinase [Desulfovibrio sp.]
MNAIPNVMTIAGSDSGGGAGIQADLKTIFALGGYGTSAITALTAQNGAEVTGIFPVSPDFVVEQITTIAKGFPLKAAKTGMLFSADIIVAVANALQKRTYPLVVDPVSISQSGYTLLEESAIDALKRELLPQSDLLTPNIPEAEMLSGIHLTDKESIFAAGEALLKTVQGAVLIKGGHTEGTIMIHDYLFQKGNSPKELPVLRIDTNNTHGTGCTLSAAIATGLAKGLPLLIAVTKAQEYLNEALRKSYTPGIGHGPVNHACRLSLSHS